MQSHPPSPSLTSATPLANQYTKLVTHPASSAGPKELFLANGEEAYPSFEGTPQTLAGDGVLPRNFIDHNSLLPNEVEDRTPVQVYDNLQVNPNHSIGNASQPTEYTVKQWFPPRVKRYTATHGQHEHDGPVVSSYATHWLSAYTVSESHNDAFFTAVGMQPSMDNMNMMAPWYPATQPTDFQMSILQGSSVPKPRIPCQYCMKTFTRVSDLARHI